MATATSGAHAPRNIAEQEFAALLQKINPADRGEVLVELFGIASRSNSTSRIARSICMNEVTSSAPVMSSLELVEVINAMREDGKAELRHDNFMAKVEKVIGKAAPKFLGTAFYTVNGARREQAVYYFPKREASLMVMSESYAVQAKVYDRMVELEGATPVAVPTTLAGALRLAAAQAEQVEAQAAELAAARPAVEFVDAYVEATGTKGFREVCKLLVAKESQFRDFLRDHRVMYLLGGEWMPYQSHMDAGRLVVKAGVSRDGEHAFSSARFTAKGIRWIAGEWAKYRLGLLPA